MVMPNFLLIGAAKAGTTALYEALKEHPQVYMSPVKEPNFFALEGDPLKYAAGTTTPGYLEQCITDLVTYQHQFQHVKDEIAIGEASPMYLYHPEAAERIQRYIPNVKLIVILRNPVERAYSNFLHHIRDGLEPFSDFKQALQAEDERMQENWWWGFYYVDASLYCQQLQRYRHIFHSDQIKVVLYEDLKQNPTQLTTSLFEFLGVDTYFTSDTSQRYNATGVPKSQFWWKFLSQPNPIKEPFKRLVPVKLRKRLVGTLKHQMLAKPELSSEVRRYLIQAFHDDILQLQELLQRDLSSWLKE